MWVHQPGGFLVSSRLEGQVDIGSASDDWDWDTKMEINSTKLGIPTYKHHLGLKLQPMSL
jgi:hypothetical protein